MSTETDNDLNRKLNDFLNTKISKKAGVVDIKYGTNPNPLVTGMEYDSRKVKKGNLFFALPGIHTNGAKYIGDALKKGASVIVHGVDFSPEKTDLEPNPVRTARYPDTVYIKTKDPRFAMSAMSDAFYRHPSQNMVVIGVTGTEGKSTTVYLIYQLFKLLGCKAGFISTVMLGDGKNDIPNPEHQTTPEAPTVHKFLAEMRNNGVEYAVIESSSHGLSKRTNRLGDVNFDVGIMTNVTHEHLEFHGTWEQYRSDKAELFRALDSRIYKQGKKAVVPSFGVINADDPSASYFASATKHITYSYSTKGAKADLSLELIESGSGGNWYDVNAFGKNITIRDKLPGTFNAGNVLAALLTVSKVLSRDIRELAALVPYLKPVRGRMYPIEKGQPFELVVDYAHTPSSFMAIFPALRERIAGRIISLFGSAGERDTKKRAEQGHIAAAYSDIVILSDEDPRGEEPMSILEEIAKGIDSPNIKKGKNLFLIPDRPEAIRKAFSLARTGDLVLLLGKAHENSIIYANETRPYDEIAEAESALAEMGYTGISEPGGAQQSR
ncbi:MAG: UDP-N-acetylmuramoyl-L-alanyl-D-glutamate--2,6-diaminopimelate ligase [Treponema sp.]|jgi:UDP-N-acetylmuramoyl-L-alanyl-D-glutamate--2,6-diaminopimelate ligase|nr:UDP-N-acetylmuramoyl-L-alanyl-D-glutamate--2,6-diaminopimelate ligase [Treponema sp.]